jgi:hypothetical protein
MPNNEDENERFARGGKARQLGEAESAGAGQRLLADYKTRWFTTLIASRWVAISMRKSRGKTA